MIGFSTAHAREKSFFFRKDKKKRLFSYFIYQFCQFKLRLKQRSNILYYILYNQTKDHELEIPWQLLKNLFIKIYDKNRSSLPKKTCFFFNVHILL